MYHSITYGDKNTWDDWHLMPSTRPVFNPPPTKTHYVDLPGGNGKLDLTESLTGYPVYENRTGSHEFYVVNGYQTWDALYSTILNYLHGRTMRAYLEDDPYFYYEGKFEVDEWRSDRSYSIITINYDVYPFKKAPSSLEEWLWDPFDFEFGVVRYYKDLLVESELVLDIIGGTDVVSPEFTVDSRDNKGMDLVLNGTTYHLNDGTSINPLIQIGNQEPSRVTIKGWGTISINYIGGIL